MLLQTAECLILMSLVYQFLMLVAMYISCFACTLIRRYRGPGAKISVLEGVYAQLNSLGFPLPVVMALSELRASPADAEWDIRR